MARLAVSKQMTLTLSKGPRFRFQFRNQPRQRNAARVRYNLEGAVQRIRPADDAAHAPRETKPIKLVVSRLHVGKRSLQFDRAKDSDAWHGVASPHDADEVSASFCETWRVVGAAVGKGGVTFLVSPEAAPWEEGEVQ